MRVVETVEIKLEWSDIEHLTSHKQTPYEVVEGAKGVATLLREIAVRKNMFTDEDRQDEMPLRVFDGMGWEMISAQLYKNMWWQPGMFVHDGIMGHPDGLSTVTLPIGQEMHPDSWDVPVVEEWKRTGKSLRVKGGKPNEFKDIRTEWMWMQQVMGYCNLLNRHHEYAGLKYRHGRFHINWSMGNYTWPYTPRYFRYLVEFEEAELRGNWAMLQAERKRELR